MPKPTSSGHRSWPVRLLIGFWRAIDFARRLFFTLLFFAILAIIGFALRGGPSVNVPQSAALVWTPIGNLVDSPENGEQELAGQLFQQAPRQTRVESLVKALNRAAKDPRIKEAVLKLDQLDSAGMAQLQTLAKAIRNFKKSGKPVIAYAGSYTQPAYFLAAQANSVEMDPMGQVLLDGFGVYNHYFKDALDKLGVTVHVFRVGKYKSAVEPFTRNDMSPAAKKADQAWLSTLWGAYKDGVARGRKLSPNSIEQYVDHFADRLSAANGNAAQVAKQSGLVDSLVTLEQLRKQVGETVGMNTDTGTFNQISDREYLAATRHGEKHPGHRVAVIVAEGPIIDGSGYAGTVGSDTLTELLRRAQHDNSIDAVVLQVNSPGGSVFASEAIRRAVLATRDAGKPVVVSMSNMAASGGYWISMDANQIFAHRTTLTGSIGIFALIPNISKPLNNLGIHTDGIGTTPLSGALRIDRPMSAQAAQALDAVIKNGYQRFIDHVAQARHMQVQAVNNIAQGRVWSGADAKRIGLVDHIGGLQDAVHAAAKLAQLKAGEYSVETLSPRAGWASKVLKRLGTVFARAGLSASIPAPRWLQQLARLKSAVAPLTWMNDPRGEYAYCACRPDLGGGH